jgi:hypothetical protein
MIMMNSTKMRMSSLFGLSRYQTDFVELGLLGRGGGGEVVKVRNRLDRRIYAIKKIILEPEEGKYAKFGAIQNRKLRREVTTISRITHKNIVRYYQAWVEGGESTSQVDAMKREQKREADDDSESSSGDDESKGWWASSPLLDGVLSRRVHRDETAQLIGSDRKRGTLPKTIRVFLIQPQGTMILACMTFAILSWLAWGFRMRFTTVSQTEMLVGLKAQKMRISGMTHLSKSILPRAAHPLHSNGIL